MNRFTLGAFAVIFDADERVLLCHRGDLDLWNLPGGGVKDGEAPWEAVVREVREEVGLEVVVERLAGVYSKPKQAEVVFSFVCRVVAGMPGLSDEADQVAYFALPELPRNTVPKQVEHIRVALAHEPAARLVIQTGPSSRELLRLGLL